MSYKSVPQIRERARFYGTLGLEHAETLALVVGDREIADRILGLVDGDLARVGSLSIEELEAVEGVGRARALALAAAVEIGRRTYDRVHGRDARHTITCAEDIRLAVGVDMGDLDQEELRVVLLNNKHEVLSVETIYRGTINSAAIRVAEILRPAIRRQCPAIVVVHNHPTGDPTPSTEDVLVTRRIYQSAQLMDIDLLDHIIIGGKNAISMKARQLGF